MFFSSGENIGFLPSNMMGDFTNGNGGFTNETGSWDLAMNNFDFLHKQIESYKPKKYVKVISKKMVLSMKQCGLSMKQCGFRNYQDWDVLGVFYYIGRAGSF